MGQFYDHLPDNLRDWARKQKMFWVATAPLSGEGHVNLSPKGTGLTFMSIDNHKIVYEDLSGSGIETISHIRENKRITILFHAFDGPPRLCRVFGTGSYHEYGSPEYNSYLPEGKRAPGSRAVIVLDIHKVGTSCGYGIPLYDFVADRPTLNNWSMAYERPEARPGTTMHDWWQDQNTSSIDGLPGLPRVFETSGTPYKHNWVRPPAVKRVNGGPGSGSDAKAKASAKLAQQGQSLKTVSSGGLLQLDEKALNGFIVGVTFAALLYYGTQMLGIQL